VWDELPRGARGHDLCNRLDELAYTQSEENWALLIRVGSLPLWYAWEGNQPGVPQSLHISWGGSMLLASGIQRSRARGSQLTLLCVGLLRHPPAGDNFNCLMTT
jgi:hypothetical protein